MLVSLQAWSPFNFGSDVDSDENETSVRSSCKDIVSSSFELAFCLFLFDMIYLFCDFSFSTADSKHEQRRE